MKLKVIIVITLLFIPVGTVFATVPQWYCPNYHQLKSRALGGDNKAGQQLAYFMLFLVERRLHSLIPKIYTTPVPEELVECVDKIGFLENSIYSDLQPHILNFIPNTSINIDYFDSLSMLFAEDKGVIDDVRRITKIEFLALCGIQKKSLRKCTPDHFRYFKSNRLSNYDIGQIRRSYLVKHLDELNSINHQLEFSSIIKLKIRKLALNGNIKAQFLLAALLEYGIGAKIDLVQAQAWRIVATAQNPPHGEHIRDGFLFMEYLTEEDKTLAKLLANDYMRNYTKLWKKPSITIIK